MKHTSFWLGMGAGMVAGATVGMFCAPKKRSMKTCVGRTIQQMGNAVDCALEDWLHTEK